MDARSALAQLQHRDLSILNSRSRIVAANCREIAPAPPERPGFEKLTSVADGAKADEFDEICPAPDRTCDRNCCPERPGIVRFFALFYQRARAG